MEESNGQRKAIIRRFTACVQSFESGNNLSVEEGEKKALSTFNL